MTYTAESLYILNAATICFFCCIVVGAFVNALVKVFDLCKQLNAHLWMVFFTKLKYLARVKHFYK